ncbi:unnamed protein product [Hymenolepis diminuta]|uniref:Uncharacterized protein n=1 Tax=Hymenolepis diminuta TaxID=6216 RepID=A0A564YR24_HYMDI|nr:unnamed protein product [Hymenolepis diminuta]
MFPKFLILPPIFSRRSTFSQHSALTHHSASTIAATYNTVINSHSKVSHATLLAPTTCRSAISILHIPAVYQRRSLLTQLHSLALHLANFCSLPSVVHLRRSLVVLGQSAPAAEFRGQDLRTTCEEMLLPYLCVPTKRDPTAHNSAYSVCDLVHVLNHRLNHQGTATIITDLHSGDIYDVGTGKGT